MFHHIGNGYIFSNKRFGIHSHIDFSIKTNMPNRHPFPHMLNIWDYWYFPHLWSHCKLHTLAVDEHPTASNSSHSSYSIQSIQQHPQCGCRSSALLRALLSPCSLIVNHRELFTTTKCDSDQIYFICFAKEPDTMHYGIRADILKKKLSENV